MTKRDVEAVWAHYAGLGELAAPQLKELALSQGLDGKGSKPELATRLRDHLLALLTPLPVETLRAALADRGVDTAGTQPELAARLQQKLLEVDVRARLKELSGGLVDQEPGKGATVRLCSWNMCNLIPDSRHKQYDRIVGLLTQFDVIAIQEVLKDEVMPFLVAKMPGYAYVLSEQVGKVRKEHYGFIYKTATIKVVQTGLFKDPNGQIERPPYVGTFSCVGPKKQQFDFSVMTIHVLFGNSKSERRGELTKLATCAQHVLSATEKEKDLFIVGERRQHCCLRVPHP